MMSWVYYMYIIALSKLCLCYEALYIDRPWYSWLGRQDRTGNRLYGKLYPLQSRTNLVQSLCLALPLHLRTVRYATRMQGDRRSDAILRQQRLYGRLSERQRRRRRSTRHNGAAKKATERRWESSRCRATAASTRPAPCRESGRRAARCSSADIRRRLPVDTGAWCCSWCRGNTSWPCWRPCSRPHTCTLTFIWLSPTALTGQEAELGL